MAQPRFDVVTRFESAALPRVVYAGIARDPAGTAFSEHTLDLLEINYHSGGSCGIVVNGTQSRTEAGAAYVYRPSFAEDVEGLAKDVARALKRVLAA